jgi:hypothetical protein
MSWGGRCFFCSSRHFRTANSTPLISIRWNLAPFDKHSWKVIILKGLFQSLAPIHLRASERTRIIDPTNQYFSWGSDKWHPGDMACSSMKSATVIFVEGFNRRAFNETRRWNTVANCVSDVNAAHGSSASVMEVTRRLNRSFRKN